VISKDSEHLDRYLKHLEARIRERQHKSTEQDEEEDLAVLPRDLASLCTSEPRECLEFVMQALQQTTAPELVRAVGDGLLEDLLNENSAAIHEEVLDHLRTNRRFRQAFACGTYASVIADWVTLFQELGTTKRAERKSLWAG
jgi:hypothetical protein